MGDLGRKGGALPHSGAAEPQRSALLDSTELALPAYPNQRVVTHFDVARPSWP
jgi:hypothetical protein